MKWKLNLPEPQIMVYYFARLIGMAPFTLNKRRFSPPTIVAKLYTLFLAAIYFSIFTIPFTFMVPGIIESRNYSTSVTLELKFKSSISVTTTFPILILFLLMSEQISYILNKLCDVGTAIKSLEIEENSGEFFKNSLFITLITNLIIIATNVILYFIVAEWPVSFAIHHSINNSLKFNFTLIFAKTFLFMRHRFALLNEKLYGVLRPADHRLSVHRLQIFAVCENRRGAIQADIEDLTDLQRIRKIELLHLDFCDLIDRMTHIFAIPILLYSFQGVIEQMWFCFRMYLVFRKPSQSYNADEILSILMSIMGPALRTFLVIVQLFSMTYASVATCREGNATKTVLSKVWDKSKSSDLEGEFSMFYLQLLHTPVVVSIFEFFDLDYSYLYKIFCVVVAYLIIMIQFDTSQPTSDT